MPNVPSHNLTDQELKVSYWYITHKLTMKRWLIIGLTAVVAGLWLYFGWQIIFYVINYQTETAQTQKLIASPSSFLTSVETVKPQDMQLSDIEVLGGENGRYDFMVQAVNPNADWLVTFDYSFVDSSSTDATPRPGFILPGEQKYLLDLGHNSASGKLQITNQQWKRISNFAQIREARMRLEINDKKMELPAKTGDPTRLIFTLVNNSPFSYWNLPIQIFLMSGGTTRSINYLNLSQVKSGESRTMSVNWSQQLPYIDNVEIVPDLNIFDNNNIMSAE
ncbi:MAG: hypothetical protein WC516_07630 [Patescibacteria group bacterium]